MKRIWALQDAKNRFSEVVDRAIAEGPQTITRRGTETAVVVSMGEYERLSARKGSLLSFLRKSPLMGVDLDVGRSADCGRDLEL